jgi:hypothetical protein
MDARPNDHDHPALSHDLPDHVGNVDEFPACAEVVDHWAYYPGDRGRMTY